MTRLTGLSKNVRKILDTTAIHSLLNEIMGSLPGEAIAERIGKSPSYVSQIRSGLQIPTAATLAIIANKFGVSHRLGELILRAEVARLETQKWKGDKDGALKESVVEALNGVLEGSAQSSKIISTRPGRTFRDFPEAFYPLAVVTGDKREERGSHISCADLGAYTATCADTRWILNIGLRPDVVQHIDKNFLLLSDDELVNQFSEMNLLVAGSPAANHLARIINSHAIFRFNYSKDTEDAINDVITKARTLSSTQLVAYQEESRSGLIKKMRSLFTGGIFDPTHPEEYVGAKYSQIAANTQFDFGVLTFASNPYYQEKCRREGRECDHKYVSIMAAGIHHPGTAHALKLLGQDCRKSGAFAKHPYGGMIRVELDMNIHFANRTMKAECQWEDVADNERQESENQKEDLLREFKIIEEKVFKNELRYLALEKEQAAECRRLIELL